jgi:four helix bundle protein
MAVKKFEDVEVWVKARQFSVVIYKVTDEGGIKKDFGLRDQLRRASVSIVSNIAKGFERNGNKEFVQFLSYAKASSGEVRAQIYIAKDLGYLNEEQFNELTEKIVTISKMISGLINYIKQSDFKGTKFVKEPGFKLEH